MSLLSLSILLMLSHTDLLAAGPKLNCQYEETIIKEANAQNVPVELALAVAQIESNCNQEAIGSFGEIGIYQIMPYHGSEKRLKNPTYNIHKGISLIKESLIKCEDMGEAAIVCYNNGTARRPKYPFLHPYYKKILGAMR